MNSVLLSAILRQRFSCWWYSALFQSTICYCIFKLSQVIIHYPSTLTWINTNLFPRWSFKHKFMDSEVYDVWLIDWLIDWLISIPLSPSQSINLQVYNSKLQKTLHSRLPPVLLTSRSLEKSFMLYSNNYIHSANFYKNSSKMFFSKLNKLSSESNLVFIHFSSWSTELLIFYLITYLIWFYISS